MASNEEKAPAEAVDAPLWEWDEGWVRIRKAAIELKSIQQEMTEIGCIDTIPVWDEADEPPDQLRRARKVYGSLHSAVNEIAALESELNALHDLGALFAVVTSAPLGGDFWANHRANVRDPEHCHLGALEFNIERAGRLIRLAIEEYRKEVSTFMNLPGGIDSELDGVGKVLKSLDRVLMQVAPCFEFVENYRKALEQWRRGPKPTNALTMGWAPTPRSVN